MPRTAKKTAVSYFRTSSATNVGQDKDSLKRQREAVIAYAKFHKLKIVDEFYDPAVSGADHIEDRPGFSRLLDYLLGNGAKMILVENASRFARDIMVQETGFQMLRSREISLIPVDAPEYFSDDSDNPTRELVRIILGAVSAFEKKGLVLKLRKARERKKAETGRCEGRPPVNEIIVREAKRLRRKNPKTGKRRSLRQVATELAKVGYLAASGKPYGAESIKRMILRRP